MTLAAALVGWLAVAPALPSAGAGPLRTEESVPTSALVLAVTIDPSLVSLAPALLAHLRAELAAGKVVVVPGDAIAGPTPNARLNVDAPEGAPQSVVLEVEFLRSGTSVRHVLDLSSVPTDGAPLAIAIAVDELIRATWSLAGVTTPPKRMEPPTASVSVAPAPRSARAEGRLLLSAVRSGDGSLSLGSDAIVVFLLGARIGVDASAGWRGSETRAAPDGSIDVNAVTAGVGASIALPARTPSRRLGAELGARVEGARVTVRGSATSGATAHSVSVLGAAAVTGVGGWLTIAGPLRLVAFAGWQFPIRAVRAIDVDALDTQVYGTGLSVALGVGAQFR
jgi:hypothetical protein